MGFPANKKILFIGYRRIKCVIGHDSSLNIDNILNHYPTKSARNVDVAIRADLLDWDI